MQPCKGCRFWRELSEADQVSPTVRLGQCRRYAPKPGSAIPFHVVWAGCGQREPIAETTPAAGQGGEERLVESRLSDFGFPSLHGITLTGRDSDMSIERLQERVNSGGLNLAVDATNGIIRHVKVLGPKSANGREYLPEAMRRAKGLYEGKAVNVDHGQPGDRRSYRDRLGRLAGVEVRPDGIFADLHFNPKHPLAEQLAWDAEHAPGNVGLSHDASGRTVRKGGTVVVEEITAVHSVDLVADPASTKGLFESADTTPKPEDYQGPAGWGDAEIAPSRPQSEFRDELPDRIRTWQGGGATFQENEHDANRKSDSGRDIAATVARWRE